MRVYKTRMREMKFIYRYIERVRHTRGSLLFEGVCLKEIYCYGILIEEEEKHKYIQVKSITCYFVCVQVSICVT